MQKNQTPAGTTITGVSNTKIELESSSVFEAIQPQCTTLKPSQMTLNDGIMPKSQAISIKPTSEPIPGLFLYEDFITKEEEDLILQGLDDHSDRLPWKPANFNGRHLGKRWGVHCNLRDRRVDAPENPLPNVIQQIILPKLKSLPTMKGCIPNEANAIEYRRSQGHWLQAHVDDRKLSKESIANLSLAGDCYMTFENRAMNRNLAVPQQKVLLPRRCLQVLTGKARYDFSHGIAHQDLLTDRRISITMRESPLTDTTAAFPAMTAGGTGSVQDLFKEQFV
jgi:alkylated DNA repair dioxygenase AlkB